MEEGDPKRSPGRISVVEGEAAGAACAGQSDHVRTGQELHEARSQGV